MDVGSIHFLGVQWRHLELSWRDGLGGVVQVVAAGRQPFGVEAGSMVAQLLV
jgi:hypothetical protein